MKEFPTLYKQTSTGAIQTWEIRVATIASPTGTLPEISTRHGQLGTDNPQYAHELIKEGKNKGKSNETSPWEQAEAEAEARWTKKLKSGYVLSVEAAQKKETDAIIEGGVVPMLAHSFDDHKKKIKYECLVQPKFDGIRMVAIIKNGKATLWSRSRKPITSLPHIISELESMWTNAVLDGEAYNHKFKHDFEKIVSAVRKENPEPGHENVQYHIYDIVNDQPQLRRKEMLDTAFRLHEEHKGLNKFLFKTLTEWAGSEQEVHALHDKYLKWGFEGAMVRNIDGLYENKRSYNLQKVKLMQDSEFKILGVEEGRGKLAGHVGTFVCETTDGKVFKAKPSGSQENLRRWFLDDSEWRGKKLTVQFQALTSDGLPRFPVGLRIRNDDE